MEGWKDIEPDMWAPEKEGDSISGVLVNKTPKVGENSPRYNIENHHGQFLVWGSAILDDRMNYAKIGDVIRITFKGMTKNKNNQDMKVFKVEIKNPAAPEVQDDTDGTTSPGPAPQQGSPPLHA